jgi:hypothetical protein
MWPSVPRRFTSLLRCASSSISCCTSASR